MMHFLQSHLYLYLRLVYSGCKSREKLLDTSMTSFACQKSRLTYEEIYRSVKMHVFVCSIILVLVAYTVDTRDIIDDMRMFLPFLENVKAPPECPPNEVYKTCTGNCSDCTQRGMCVVTKCIEACDCIPRFFRVTADGPCEPVAKCPIPECGENEVFRECGPICDKCTTFRCRIINCNHRCYCKEGYLRNAEGACIPQEECPKRKRCSRTEEWAESGVVNEFCPIVKNATSSNETQEIAQCYCMEGFKRNSLGYCISGNHCPSIQCLGVEVYHDCVPKCNSTCRNYENPNCTEDDNCYPGCFCPPGYVMNDFRACTPVKKCSLDTEQQVLAMQPSNTTNKDDSTNATTISEDITDSSNDDVTTEEYHVGSLEESIASKFTENGQVLTTEIFPTTTNISLTTPASITNIPNENVSAGNSSYRESMKLQTITTVGTTDESDFDNEEI